MNTETYLKELEKKRKIRKIEICNAIGGELADENTCMVNGFPLDVSSPLFFYKPKSMEITLMSPNQFFSYAPRIELDEGVIERIKNAIRKKEPIEPLFLDVKETGEVFGHEGRHRAKACEELGIDKIPVILFCRGNDYNFVDKERCRWFFRKIKK